MSGPLTKLKWSDWILAATDKRPLGYTKQQFRPPKFAGWGHTFVRQNLFDKASSSPSIYEVGVKFPDAAKRKIYVMYFKPVYGMSWRAKKINALTLVKSGRERIKMANLIGNQVKIFFRRGSGNSGEVQAAARYIHKNFDYAWGWKRRSQRKVVKHGVYLS